MQGLAQITNWLPLLFFTVGALVIIGVIASVITPLMRMEPKRRENLLICAFMTSLVLIIAIGGLAALRDSMRDETLKACQLQGMNYTQSQWENGEVNYTKCNITSVSGLL